VFRMDLFPSTLSFGQDVIDPVVILPVPTEGGASVPSAYYSMLYYFVIRDKYARGATRVLCLSYITVNRTKLDRWGVLLRYRLKAVTTLLKVSAYVTLKQWYDRAALTLALLGEKERERESERESGQEHQKARGVLDPELYAIYQQPLTDCISGVDAPSGDKTSEHTEQTECTKGEGEGEREGEGEG
ncbi:hypothetical protein KIPB_013224, partial [Kipferlia bialata]